MNKINIKINKINELQYYLIFLGLRNPIFKIEKAIFARASLNQFFSFRQH